MVVLLFKCKHMEEDCSNDFDEVITTEVFQRMN